MIDSIIKMFMGVFALIGGVLMMSPIHEFSHMVVAKLGGHDVVMDGIGINSGSITVIGNLSSFDSSIIAMGGTLGVVAVGLALIYLTDSHTLRISGVVLLCRAWVDTIPWSDVDGSILAQISSMSTAWLFSIIVLLVSGVAVMSFTGYNRRIS